MKSFEVVIKSHTDAPDFETVIEAESKEEAAQMLAARFNSEGEDWDVSRLMEFIHE